MANRIDHHFEDERSHLLVPEDREQRREDVEVQVEDEQCCDLGRSNPVNLLAFLVNVIKQKERLYLGSYFIVCGRRPTS